MTIRLSIFASALLAAGVTCLALASCQDHQTAQLAADRDTALARCQRSQARLECQQLAENAYHEQYTAQIARGGSFEIAGALLLAAGVMSWLWGSHRTR